MVISTDVDPTVFIVNHTQALRQVNVNFRPYHLQIASTPKFLQYSCFVQVCQAINRNRRKSVYIGLLAYCHVPLEKDVWKCIFLHQSTCSTPLFSNHRASHRLTSGPAGNQCPQSSSYHRSRHLTTAANLTRGVGCLGLVGQAWSSRLPRGGHGERGTV